MGSPKPKTLSKVLRSTMKARAARSSSTADAATLQTYARALHAPDYASENLAESPSDIFELLDGISDGEKNLEKELKLPWFPALSEYVMPVHRKDQSRERKAKWVFGNGQGSRFDSLVNMCANKLGSDSILQVFDKLGKEVTVTECNALIKKFIEQARVAPEETVAEKYMQLAFAIFTLMKEQGFKLEEVTYGPLLEYLVDMSLTKEFSSLCGVIRDGNPSSLSRLGYYEMRLWIRVNDEKKIRELCNDIENYDGGSKSFLQESYLLALCESDRKEEILQLLESMDITKFSSPDFVARIFQCLGRLLLESLAEKFLLEFKACDFATENTSNLIYSFVVGIPNLEVENVASKYKNMHMKLEVTPSSASYKKLILYCCNALKVHVAIELVEEMCELGLTVSMEELHSILQASSESCDFNLVHRIYSLISQHRLRSSTETFRCMINLCVKMKDYEGAYGLLSELGKMNLLPTAGMYNSIILGYFREKNMQNVLRVLEQMKDAGVEPDSMTYSHLITHCNSEKGINMYYEEMKLSGVQFTKQVFMALVNAYAACGQFEKSKQVLLDKRIPAKSINEIKSVLVQALASHGQMSDAFETYEEIKRAGCSLEPKAVISLIEHLQSDEEALSRLLLLLETLNDPHYWLDGCLRTIVYCIRYKHLRPAVDLLEQLRDLVCTDELALEVTFDKLFYYIAESEPTSLQFGLDLLHAMKEELGLTPSRKCLDFLLHACVSAEDLQSALFVWQEYQAAGLPYNALSFLRMYQALLAAGDYRASKILLSKINQDDFHVRCIISSCKTTYLQNMKEEEKKKEKETKKKKKKKKNVKAPKVV